ncbi:MFS transporter [Lichenicoccus sp.]|uniref:MFS transporter n=1 Tax=Lichenicoccus sp. TaxID=2781899 RepID=UPI003D0F3D81
MSQSVAGRQVPLRAPIGGTQGRAGLVLGTISLCHMLNDTIQSLLTAIYPLLKGGFHLSFSQIGLLTLTYQITASLLQPLVGQFTDRRPLPWSLAAGMSVSMTGLLILALAQTYAHLLGGAALLGVGSSIFHPEASRIARLASGGRHGFAQSVFQVGGNFGTSLGPLLAAFVVLPNGRASLAWFCLLALLGVGLLAAIGRWYSQRSRLARRDAAPRNTGLSRRQTGAALTMLIALVFSKYFYLASIGSYYIFYLMHRFGVSAQTAQVELFVFLGATAAGTFAGGPIGDRIGRKYVIWGSILGVLPFTLALPHVGFGWTIALSVVIGLVLSSAFSAILVYATELLPGRVGMVSGLFFGLAFGMGGLGAAVLGVLADHAGIDAVYEVCAFLPAIGILALFLPNLERAKS